MEATCFHITYQGACNTSIVFNAACGDVTQFMHDTVCTPERWKNNVSSDNMSSDRGNDGVLTLFTCDGKACEAFWYTDVRDKLFSLRTSG